MPRYHFNVYDGITAMDELGTELNDMHCARREAMLIAGELIKNEAGKERLGSEWRLEVTDMRGMILLRIDIVLTEAQAFA